MAVLSMRGKGGIMIGVIMFNGRSSCGTKLEAVVTGSGERGGASITTGVRRTHM